MSEFVAFFVGVFVTVLCVMAYVLIRETDDEPANPLKRGFDVCRVSHYGVHNFLGVNRRCTFCGRALEDCLEGQRTS